MTLIMDFVIAGLVLSGFLLTGGSIKPLTVAAVLGLALVGGAQAQPQPLMVEQWHGWEDLGGAVSRSPTCIASQANHLDCFSAQSGGVLGWRRWDSASWVNWVTLNGIAVDSFYSSRTECVSWGPDHLDCFARRDSDKALFHRTFDGNYVSGWEALGGVLTSDPSCISTAMRKLDCFARGTDGQLYRISFDGDIWSGWTALGGQVLDSTKPSCAVFRGEIDCVAVRTDSRLQMYRITSTGWSIMDTQIGNTVQAPSAGADPSPRCVVSPSVNPQTSRLQCFAPEFAPGPVLGRWIFDGNSWGMTDMGAIPAGLSYDWDCVAMGDERVDCVDMIGQGTQTGFSTAQTGLMLRYISLDFLPNSNWSTVALTTATGGAYPAFVRCASWGPRRLDCFASGGLANTHLWHAWQALGRVILDRPARIHR